MSIKAGPAFTFARSLIYLRRVKVGSGRVAALPRWSGGARWICATATRGATMAPTSTMVEETATVDDFFDLNTSFSELGLSVDLCARLKSVGIERPTHVQVATIPRLLAGLERQMDFAQMLREAEGDEDLPLLPPLDVDDVMVVGAETGCGKTLTYLLPFVEAMRRRPDATLTAVVLQPTRELCAQTVRLLMKYAPDDPITSTALVLAGGGLPDVRALRDARIIVATPAALCQHVRFSEVAERNDKYIVVDEADLLLSGSFLTNTARALSAPSMKPFSTRRMPYSQSRNRNRLVFVGATYPHWVGERVKSVINWISKRYPSVQHVTTEGIHRRSERLASTWTQVEGDVARAEALANVFRDAETNSGRVMVFCGTAARVDALADAIGAPRHMLPFALKPDVAAAAAEAASFAAAPHAAARAGLRDGGMSVVRLHKKMPAAARREALERFASDDADVLICTDVAARGLDMGRVTHVVEYDFADNVVGHLHRIGRTARAGANGRTHHFYSEVSEPLVHAIRSRDARDENVVEGVFSRNRSFRRKYKKRLREEAESQADQLDSDDVTQ